MTRLLLAGSADSALPVGDLYSEAMPAASQIESRIFRVGPSRAYATIGAAVTAAAAARSGTQWALVIVDPGTYTEQTSAAAWVALVGATGNPADVILQWESPTGYSPLNTWGGPVYAAGITCRLLPYAGTRTGSGIYAIHHAAIGSSIFERLNLRVTNKEKMGMDGSPGSVTWLIGCDLRSDDGSTFNTNMHGGTGTSPLRLVYDNCTAPDGLNYNSLGTGAADQVYVTGGSVPLVSLAGSATKAFIDPAVTTVTAGAGVTVTRTATLPERPVRGIA